MMIHCSLTLETLMAHTDDVVSLQDDDDVDVDVGDVFSESEQAVNQFTLRNWPNPINQK